MEWDLVAYNTAANNLETALERVRAALNVATMQPQLGLKTREAHEAVRAALKECYTQRPSA